MDVGILVFESIARIKKIEIVRDKALKKVIKKLNKGKKYSVLSLKMFVPTSCFINIYTNNYGTKG